MSSIGERMAAVGLAFGLIGIPPALSAEPDADPEAAMAAFVERISTAEKALQGTKAWGSDTEQAQGYMHLSRSIIRALESQVLQDPDYPWFRILDFWLREGGDNPDQRYAFSPVRGGEAYRIWGKLGSAARVEVQLYAGEPWAGTGRSAGYLVFEDIEVASDGSFTVELGPGELERKSYLRNPPEATTVFVRHIYDDWNQQQPGEVHIDRVGYEGKRAPLPSRADLAARLRAAADMLEKSAVVWPGFVKERYAEARDPNTMAELIDTYALGGARGRWMSGGYYELPEGKALLVAMPETRAQYQAIQLADMYFSSLEHANQVSSLTSKQSLQSPDDTYYVVISESDPGHANWLDTGGTPRGVFLLRYDGVQGEIPEAQQPSARLVDASELPGLIPGFAKVSENEREKTRALRRRHLQRRSGR